MKDTLRECPLCGGEADVIGTVMINHPTTFYIECADCGAGIAHEKFQGNAIDSWNTRPIEDALRAELTALRAKVDEANKGPLELSHVLLSDACDAELARKDALIAALRELVEAQDNLVLVYGDFREVKHNPGAEEYDLRVRLYHDQNNVVCTARARLREVEGNNAN